MTPENQYAVDFIDEVRRKVVGKNDAAVASLPTPAETQLLALATITARHLRDLWADNQALNARLSRMKAPSE